MDKLSKPLCGLTVEEYIILQKEIFTEQLEILGLHNQELKLEKPEDDIIFLEEVMAITTYKKPTIYSKISRFEIPVLSRRKPLTFSRKELIQWIKDGKPSVTAMKAEEYLKNKS